MFSLRRPFGNSVGLPRLGIGWSFREEEKP